MSPRRFQVPVLGRGMPETPFRVGFGLGQADKTLGDPSRPGEASGLLFNDGIESPDTGGLVALGAALYGTCTLSSRPGKVGMHAKATNSCTMLYTLNCQNVSGSETTSEDSHRRH